MNSFKNYLSHRLAVIGFTLISVVAINLLQQVVQNFGWDNSYSIVGAKNITEGHGFSFKTVSPGDFSRVVYEPIIKWPPGYSWLLIIVQKITRTDWIHSAYILNGIGLTLLVLVFRQMLIQLAFPTWIINIGVLYFGFIFHYFSGVYFTDIWGILFFMSGCSFLYQYVKSDNHPIYYIFLSAISCSFAAYQKYLYFGLAFIPLIFLLYYGYKAKDSQFMRAATTGLAVIFICVGLLILYLNSSSGKAMYITPPAKEGFFPGQLLWLFPIIPGSFLNLNFLNYQLADHFKISYENLFTIWSIINFGCIIWLGYKTLSVMRNRFFILNIYRGFYAMMTVFVIAFNFIFLGILSMIFSRSYADTRQWVHIQEARYFAPFSILILQFAIYLFLEPTAFFGKLAARIYRILIVCILIEEIAHSGYFIVNQALVKKQLGMNRSSDQCVFKALQLTQVELNRKNQVIVCSWNAEIPMISSLAGSASLINLSFLRQPIPASGSLLIITVVDQLAKANLKPDFFKMDTRLVCELNGYAYYFTNIPRSTDSQKLP